MITIDEAQEMRKQGMYLVTDKNFTKVVLLTTNQDEAIEVAKIKKRKMYNPLVKMNWTKEDTYNALRQLELGLQCSSLNSKF